MLYTQHALECARHVLPKNNAPPDYSLDNQIFIFYFLYSRYLYQLYSSLFFYFSFSQRIFITHTQTTTSVCSL